MQLFGCIFNLYRNEVKILTQEEVKDWYTNKDLFEMIQSFQLQVSTLTKEMEKTTTIIRDYNGLRGTINDVDNRLGKIEQTIVENKDSNKTQRQNKSNYIGWGIAIIMFIMTLLQYLKG